MRHIDWGAMVLIFMFISFAGCTAAEKYSGDQVKIAKINKGCK